MNCLIVKTIFYLFLILLFTSCLGDIENYRSNSQSDINIYLVKEGQLTIHESDVDLDLLELERTPWVTNSEIELYDWSSHTFYLNTDKEKEKYSGRHFLVVSGDERLFIGVFFPMYMSSIPQMPSIIPEDGLFYPADVIHFGQLGHQFTGDIEKQNDFKKALLDAGLLHEGIKVELTQVQKKSISAIAYTFEVTNHDNKTLYIADPDKMGASRFHYITNGMYFNANDSYCYSNLSDFTAFDTFSEKWYFRLKPGQTMTRTVDQKGFNCLQSGKVKCQFSFPGANIKTGEWKKTDGRVWLGDYFVEKELVIQ